MPFTASRSAVKRYDILVYSDGAVTRELFLSCGELALTICINDSPFVRVACSGQHLSYLVPGLLFSCGLIANMDDVVSLDFSSAQGDGNQDEEVWVNVRLRNRHDAARTRGGSTLTITSAMGWTLPVSARRLPRIERPPFPSWDPRIILDAALELDDRSEIFHQTGACHNAALLDREGIIFNCLDVGRHNAIDTLVGYLLTEGLEPADHMIVSSGRIASEIAQKAVRARIPIFASFSRAMSRAIDVARSTGLTLLGNVTSGRMHLYHENGQLKLS